MHAFHYLQRCQLLLAFPQGDNLTCLSIAVTRLLEFRIDNVWVTRGVLLVGGRGGAATMNSVAETHRCFPEARGRLSKTLGVLGLHRVLQCRDRLSSFHHRSARSTLLSDLLLATRAAWPLGCAIFGAGIALRSRQSLQTARRVLNSGPFAGAVPIQTNESLDAQVQLTFEAQVQVNVHRYRPSQQSAEATTMPELKTLPQGPEARD
jgi:hypothetical protein